jgi:hypothetical protein
MKYVSLNVVTVSGHLPSDLRRSVKFGSQSKIKRTDSIVFLIP